MFKIQANASGTRSIEVSEAHLETIRKYKLLDRLVSSNGIVDEPTLDKLKMNVRSMLESSGVADKALLDLCLDVIYNNNMKALGLQNLTALYRSWEEKAEADKEEEKTEGQLKDKNIQEISIDDERIQAYRLVADNKERDRITRMGFGGCHSFLS